MKIREIFHSDHIGALKLELKQKFAHELSPEEGETYLKRKTNEALACLDSAIVSVDILRSPDFNFRLDPTKNFYGLKLGTVTPNGHLYARRKTIRHSLQMSMQMMNKKDMWKLFLSSVLMEVDKDSKPDLMLRVGTDHKFATDKDSNDTADFIVAGPRPALDFPLLIVDICSDEDPKGQARRGRDPYNPAKIQNMMTTTLVDFFNTRKHWPLTELVHVCVYGLIIHNDEFYISKMALRPERGTKLAFVYTRGKRALPYNLFKTPKPNGSYNYEAWAQTHRGDADSTDDEEYDSDDEWVICHLCQTCHPRDGKHDFEKEFEALELEETPKAPAKAPAAQQQRSNGAKVYKRAYGGGVVAIISLMQTVMAQHEFMKSKDAQYKKLKNANQ